MDLEFLRGKVDGVKKFVGDTWGKITDDEAKSIADEPNNLFGVVKEKFGAAKEDIVDKFDGFNFDEFKDGVTFDEVKDKVGEIFDRLKK